MIETKHIVSSFDNDLETIQALVMRMGGLVEEALRDASMALETRDAELAERVRQGDHAIDELDELVKTDTAKVLALRSPSATDLRTVLTVISISNSLERCGDLAKNIAKRVPILVDSGMVEDNRSSLRRMARHVGEMLSDSLDSYIHRDVDRANDIVLRDEDADHMYNVIFRSLLTHMMEDPRNITAGMHLHFIAKNIERIGDHATAIAEQTMYLVTGNLPDEDRPKRDLTEAGTAQADG
ncbi:phosphate signaling complex protein PhoU [Pukyongiella litopenaei]|uniref:Phosphate-specific transport system accessory protein PhoU n=1 Tax=Pukyongiella litopenaei TaxID=2605946 RepID=A0A2S0MQ75_9RHOB|nr:phosphate signaling complex protein PhoU [Pukyongiella litopenaei]AVO37996.1 phosphate signaling complex protein PhoU [Pukyongiella litopenaei]